MLSPWAILALGIAIYYIRDNDPDRLMRRGRQAIAEKNWDKANECADRLMVAERRNMSRIN